MNVGVMSQLTFGAWKHETTAHFCTLVGFSNWAPSITISLMDTVTAGSGALRAES